MASEDKDVGNWTGATAMSGGGKGGAEGVGEGLDCNGIAIAVTICVLNGLVLGSGGGGVYRALRVLDRLEITRNSEVGADAGSRIVIACMSRSCSSKISGNLFM